MAVRIAGVAHFVIPKGFDEIVPHALPLQIPLIWLALRVRRTAPAPT